MENYSNDLSHRHKQFYFVEDPKIFFKFMYCGTEIIGVHDVGERFIQRCFLIVLMKEDMLLLYIYIYKDFTEVHLVDLGWQKNSM